MTKLDINYWASKTDDLNDVDVAAITDAFCTGTENGNGFTYDEKVQLAEIMLACNYVCSDDDKAHEVMRLVEKYNTLFAVDPLFVLSGGSRIGLWRYNYRKLMKTIPDTYASEAIVHIYKRLGYGDISERDVLEVGASNNIYDVFLKNFKEEANGGYIMSDMSEMSYICKCYLNTWLLYEKLGFMKLNLFELFAEIGELFEPVSQFIFGKMNKATSVSVEEAADRSRGRMYPTFCEIETVVNL